MLIFRAKVCNDSYLYCERLKFELFEGTPAYAGVTANVLFLLSFLRMQESPKIYLQ